MLAPVTIDVTGDVAQPPVGGLKPRGVRLWSPASLAVAPQLALDARRSDKMTLSGTTITGIRTVHTDVASNAPNLITYSAANAGLNGRPSIDTPGTAAQSLNFSTNLGNLVRNKAGCTLIFCGKFATPSPGAFNSAIVNVSANTSSGTRASIATSSTVANCPRTTIRRLDADTANGDDFGTTNIGVVPWIGILRVDHTGAVVGAGTPTKHYRQSREGLALGVYSEATGLGSGNTSDTASAYIGFFNAGTTAQAWVQMFYGAIMDYVLTDIECEKYEGWLAHALGLPTMLDPAHPYRTAPPGPDLEFLDEDGLRITDESDSTILM